MTTTAPRHERDSRRPAGHKSKTAPLRLRLQIGSALAGIALPLSVPGLALADNECGAPIGGVIACAAAGSPYAAGIRYDAGAQDLTLTLSADAEVRTTTNGTIGVDVTGRGDNLTLNLQGGVITEGTGVQVDSDAAITTVTVNSIEAAGDGLYVFSGDGSAFIDVGSIESAQTGLTALSFAGPITINVHSILTTNGQAIDAFSNGNGTLTINSDGQLSTSGYANSGIVAQTNGSIFVDVNNVTTQGQYSRGIVAVIYDAGLIDITAASVATAGLNSHAVSAVAGAPGGAIVLDVASATTQGDNSSGIFATSVDGNIDITIGGASTTGDNATAVHASSISGAVKVNSTGTISTTGISSLGILAESANGATSVTNSGTVTTTGDNSAGIVSRSNSNNATVTNSGSVRTTGTNANAVTAESDQGDVTVINSGTVSATGNDSYGLYAKSIFGDVTVISTGSASAAGEMSSAVHAQSDSGNVSIDVALASGGGTRSNAVSGFSMTGNVVATVGAALTTGEAYAVNLHSRDGDVSLVAGNVVSQGDGATGVFATSDLGHVKLKVNSVTTLGLESNGIDASSLSGPISIETGGPITISGDRSDGIFAYSDSGAVTVDALGAIMTSGANGDGINVNTDNDVTISASQITTTGRLGDGILVNSRSGKLTVVANGVIATHGNTSEGIDLLSSSGDIDVMAASVFTKGVGSTGIEVESTSGAVRVVSNGPVVTEGKESAGITAAGGAGATVNAVSVSTSGEDADAIFAYADTGDVRVNALDVHASGAGSNGIVARSDNGSLHVRARNSRAAGGNAINATSGTGAANVSVSGTVYSGNSDAILIDGATASTVLIEATGHVSGATSAIVANGPNVTITNAGRLLAGSAPTVIATQGITTLTNIGTFSGGVRFGAGDDFVGNGGTFALSGTSDFGGGTDRFVNTGVVSLLTSATLSGLERFENAGLVTLANNKAGDVLTVSGDYVGMNSVLALDVNNTSGVLSSDQLVIGGAASGTTAIALNYSGSNTLAPGATLKLIDAAGGSAANAFTLTPETANAGFLHYGLRYDGMGDDFFIVSSEGTALYQTLKINEGAQTLWRQSADAWSAHTAALRDPAKDTEASGRFWTQIYGSNDTRGQNFASTTGGLTRNIDVSYRQEHAGGQFGVDLGTIGNTGLTYGLTGGYLDSALKFAGTADRTDFRAFNLGAYTGGQWGPYFVNALAKYDLIKAKTHSATAGYAETLDGRAYGLQVEAGARFGNSGFFVEPVASLAYSRTDLDTLQALGNDVDFDTLDGLRSKIGARIGGASSLAGGVATFYLGAHLVKEFESKDGIRLVSGGTSSALANDPVDAYGQLQLGVNFASESGVTGYIEGTAATSSDYENYGGRIGLRLSF